MGAPKDLISVGDIPNHQLFNSLSDSFGWPFLVLFGLDPVQRGSIFDATRFVQITHQVTVLRLMTHDDHVVLLSLSGIKLFHDVSQELRSNLHIVGEQLVSKGKVKIKCS